MALVPETRLIELGQGKGSEGRDAPISATARSTRPNEPHNIMRPSRKKVVICGWDLLGAGAAQRIAVPAVPYSPSVAVMDWNNDGDPDLIVGTAYGYFC